MKRSNEILVVAVALAAAVFLPNVNAAQDKAPPAEGRRGDPAQQERRGQRMAEELGLSADQKAQIKAINQSYRPQLDALRDDQALSREQRREKAKALNQEREAKVDAILTPEQRTKAQAMREKARERMKEHGGRKGRPDHATDGPPPPPKGE